MDFKTMVPQSQRVQSKKQKRVDAAALWLAKIGWPRDSTFAFAHTHIHTHRVLDSEDFNGQSGGLSIFLWVEFVFPSIFLTLSFLFRWIDLFTKIERHIIRTRKNVNWKSWRVRPYSRISLFFFLCFDRKETHTAKVNLQVHSLSLSLFWTRFQCWFYAQFKAHFVLGFRCGVYPTRLSPLVFFFFLCLPLYLAWFTG